MLQNGWRTQSILVGLPSNRVRMANTSAFPSLSQICLETAKALKREGALEQRCSERGWPVYLHHLHVQIIPPCHAQACLLYTPRLPTLSFIGLCILNFLFLVFFLNFKLAGRWEEFPPKTWNCSGAFSLEPQLCPKVQTGEHFYLGVHESW